MLLKEILAKKGCDVLTIAPEASLTDVVNKMVDNRCGSLVVCDGETMVGIISERDILRALAESSASLSDTQVSSRMTTEVVTGAPDNNINDIMGLMTRNRIRHLPIMSEGKLAGMISIGDVVKAQHDRLTMENEMLMNYIQS